MSNYSDGRMIRKDISKSNKLDDLSKESIILFLMLVPHYSSHGKLNGEPAFIKGEIVPRLKWFTIPLIEKCLKEINDKTNVKWFEFEGLKYIHSLSWFDHQKLDKNKIGLDKLPSYSRVTPELVPHKVEVEVKEEVEDKDKEEVKDKLEIEYKDITSLEKLSFSSFKNVYLTTEQHKLLSSRFGSRLEDMIETLGSYIASHGAERKYKNHYATIIQWDLKDKKKIESNRSMQSPPPAKSIETYDTRTDCLVNGCPGKIDNATRECSMCNTDEYKPIHHGKIKIALKSV